MIDVDEYYRLAATGLLAPDARVELLDGEIVEMAPIGSPHGSCVMRLNAAFSGPVTGRALVSVQGPLRIGRYSEPEPDFMLLRLRPDVYSESHPGPADVLLLVEVANSSAKFDRRRKIPLYGKAGIPEVWLIDLKAKVIEVYRGETVTTYRAGDTISPQAFSDIEIEASYLLV